MRRDVARVFAVPQGEHFSEVELATALTHGIPPD